MANINNIDINLIIENIKYPIFLKIDKTHVLYIDDNTLIKDLKEFISYPKDFYYITYAGKILDDNNSTLSSMGVKKKATLYLNVKAFKKIEKKKL